MACMCAETFAAECGCGSKAAERYEAYEDPISDRQEYKIKELGGKLGEDMTRSEASDYIKELQGRESGTWRAESGPLPADPRVSPLNEGLYSPSDTPEMASEGNSYTNYQPLPEWPPAARHIITGLSKWERDESDKYRCGPVYLIDGEWSWCNGGSGDLGHIDGGGGSGPLCSYCGMNMETGSFSAESFGAEMKDSHLTVSQRVLRAVHDQYPALYEDIEEGTQFPPEELEDTGDYDDAVDIAETMQLVRLLSADIRNASEPIREFYDINAESFGAEDFNRKAVSIIDYPDSGERVTYQLSCGHNITVENDWFSGDAKEGLGEEWECFECMDSFGAESKFDKLAKEIAEEYEEKGKSPKEAMEIGEATAAKIGRAKFGKRKFAKMGKKAEDDIDFDKSKADRNKDGRISDWERAVGNAVAKGIRENKRAEVGPHVPTRIAATTTPRGVVKTYDSIPAGDGHVVGQYTANMDYAPSGMYGAETITDSISKGFGSVLGIMSGLIIGGFAMNAVALLKSDDEN